MVMFTKMAQIKCLPFFAVFSKYGKLFVSPDPTLKNGTSSSCRNSTAIYKEKKSLCLNTPRQLGQGIKNYCAWK